MEQGGIYQLRCLINDTVYIGSAKSFEWRWGSHLYELRKGTHVNPHLQRAFNKYGEDSFKFEILEVLGDYQKKVYFERENFFIDQAKANKKCYNIAKAEGGWTYHTLERREEIRKKVSESLKRYVSSLTPKERSEKYGKGKIGVKRTEEEKKKISDSLTGIKRSDETKQKMSKYQLSRPLEEKQRIGRIVGLNNKGRPPPNRKRVLVDDKEFMSLKDAAIFLNSSSSALSRAMKRGEFKGHKIMFTDDSQVDMIIHEDL